MPVPTDTVCISKNHVNRDGVLDTIDLALLAEEWLKVTVWAE